MNADVVRSSRSGRQAREPWGERFLMGHLGGRRTQACACVWAVAAGAEAFGGGFFTAELR